MRPIITLLTTICFIFCTVSVSAQSYQYDTLELKVYFEKDSLTVNTSFKENARQFAEFEKSLIVALSDLSASVSSVSVSTVVSPDTNNNEQLSASRAVELSRFLSRHFALPLYLFRMHFLKEDLDQMSKKIYPGLHSSIGTVQCVIQRPITNVPVQKDTVYVNITDIVRDTVYLKPDNTYIKSKLKGPKKDFIARKPVFAAKTNALAIPTLNVGVEVPIGRHWSVAADYYYPWIFRGNNLKTCNQLLGFDIEGRYWFSDKKFPEQSRLLGHSVGLYAGGGYYDFERNWMGHQGEFLNVGADYKYAMPLFRGRIHLEFELGLGYIYSKAIPYKYLENRCYVMKDMYKVIHWIGPTRAQVSVVVPIYITREQWSGFWTEVNIVSGRVCDWVVTTFNSWFKKDK